MSKDLSTFAAQIRYLTLREFANIGYGHLGGSLSIVEALAAIYGGELKFDPKNPDWDGRDYFVLSKGHAGPALYATLAACGFFGVEKLWTLNANGTQLPSHPDRIKVEGVDMTTGSMGQGVSAAAGIAYGLKAQGKPNRVYSILGDGELNEGQCWEAIQFISAQNLTNMVVLVDHNKKQLDGWTHEISGGESYDAKFESFGFHSVTVDGHDVDAIAAALADARTRTDKPTCIVLDSEKGAGVQFVVDTMDNHHMRLDEEGKKAVAAAIQELGEQLAAKGISYE